MIESSKAKAAKVTAVKSEGKKADVKKSGAKTDPKNAGKPEQSYKFENYFDKKIPQKYIRPHQVFITCIMNMHAYSLNSILKF